jgi:hypothetical protein
MKAISGAARPGWLLPAAGVLLFAISSFAAPETSATARYSTNAADRHECERQLNIIYGALKNYQAQHDNQYPEKLSDLNPQFIHDLNLLSCPYVREHGGLRSWRKQFRELSHDPNTSYSYEFGLDPLDYNLWRGIPKKTYRDLKLGAVKQVGLVVPLVRCPLHRPWLNLAMSGQIYGSGWYWERNYSTNDDLVSVGTLLPSPPQPPLTAADFPPRDPRAEPQLLDLTDFYNATLTNSWQGFPGNNLAALPSGVQTLGGTRFDIRGVIQLGTSDLPVVFPKQVSGIRVAQKCRRLHFLHAVSLLYNGKLINGFYVIHYADGQVHQIPLVNDQQIADWWRSPESAKRPSDAKEVWTGQNEAATAYEKVLCLHRYTWENPRPEIPIATLTFDSGPEPRAPFVVAITAE